MRKDTQAFNIEVQGVVPEWVKNFITYDKETHWFTVWDETQAGEVGKAESWREAVDLCLEYAETIENGISRWKVLLKCPAPLDTFVLIKGDSGMSTEKTYVIKAKYSDLYGWVTVQNDAVSDEFPSKPTHWMEVPE